MKINRKSYIYALLGIFALFLAMRYWDTLESLLKIALSAASPLIIGAAIAYVLNIWMSFYRRKLFKKSDSKKFKKPLCLILAIASFCAVAALVIGIVLPELIRCIKQLIISLQPFAADIEYKITHSEKIMEILGELGINIDMIKSKLPDIASVVGSALNSVMLSLMSIITSTVSAVFSAFMAVTFAIYILLDKERLTAQINRLVNAYMSRFKDRLCYIADTLNNSFHSFIVGQCTEAVILGTLCTLGMVILRLQYAVMIGVLVGFTALIPIVGAYIGAIVGAVMLCTISPVKAIIFIVFLIMLQQFEGNIIYPRVVGGSIGLPAIWVLAAITIGGGVMGIGGMLIGVPLASAVYNLIKDDLIRRSTKKSAAKAADDLLTEEKQRGEKGTDA